MIFTEVNLMNETMKGDVGTGETKRFIYSFFKSQKKREREREMKEKCV